MIWGTREVVKDRFERDPFDIKRGKKKEKKGWKNFDWDRLIRIASPFSPKRTLLQKFRTPSLCFLFLKHLFLSLEMLPFPISPSLFSEIKEEFFWFSPNWVLSYIFEFFTLQRRTQSLFSFKFFGTGPSNRVWKTIKNCFDRTMTHTVQAGHGANDRSDIWVKIIAE